MASIHKRAKSPYWFCEYRAADGRWLKKSTKQRDRKKALEWCVTLQAAEDAISRGSASEAQLRQIISESMARIEGRSIQMPTVREWFGQWLDGKAGANSPGTLTRYRQAIRDFLDALGPKADGRLESVTQRDIIDFRNGLRDLGKSSSTINLTVAKIIAAPFKMAFEQGFIRHHPTAGLPKLAETSRKRKQAFTVEQVRQLLTVAEGDWRGAILAGYTTGARLGDVANLQWSSIDFENGVIAFHQRKVQDASDEETVIGLHPDFEAWLQTIPADQRKGHVFPTLADRGSAGRSGLSGQFAAILRQAGIESEAIREKVGKGRKVHALSFHSFRHTAASRVFSGKVVEQAQMAVTGHTRGRTLKTYTHVDLEAVKSASAMIPRL